MLRRNHSPLRRGDAEKARRKPIIFKVCSPRFSPRLCVSAVRFDIH
jgi:hypothetical protein